MQFNLRVQIHLPWNIHVTVARIQPNFVYFFYSALDIQRTCERQKHWRCCKLQCGVKTVTDLTDLTDLTLNNLNVHPVAAEKAAKNSINSQLQSVYCDVFAKSSVNPVLCSI